MGGTGGLSGLSGVSNCVPEGGSPDPTSITPAHVYFYDDARYGVTFGELMGVVGNPAYTVNGVAILAAGLESDQTSVLCQLESVGATTGMSVIVPEDDPAVTSQGGGLFVTAGTYPFELPPALANAEPPSLSGYSDNGVVGEEVGITPGNWSGYGETCATFVLGTEVSADGVSGWSFRSTGDTTTLEAEDEGMYIRPKSIAYLAGVVESEPAYGDAIGPIAPAP